MNWKIIIPMAAVSLAGWFEQFDQTLKTCTTQVAHIAANTSVTTVCDLGIPAWAVGVVGMIPMVLLGIASMPMFKGTPPVANPEAK